MGFAPGDTVEVVQVSRGVQAGVRLELIRPSRRYSGAWEAWREGTGGKWVVLVDECACQKGKGQSES